MVTYKNILFCTDFSANAQVALPYAIDLAKKYGAVLHLTRKRATSLSLSSLPTPRRTTSGLPT
jgi:nucleotide-binding universal stress UspA family protein